MRRMMLSMVNLYYYQELMRALRTAIEEKVFDVKTKQLLEDRKRLL